MLYDDGDGRKKIRNTKNENKEKIPRLVTLPSLLFFEMEADCFLVPEDTENKPDLP